MVKGLVLGKTTRGEKKREEERREQYRHRVCATCYAYKDESYFTLMSLLLLPPRFPPFPPVSPCFLLFRPTRYKGRVALYVKNQGHNVRYDDGDSAW